MTRSSSSTISDVPTAEDSAPPVTRWLYEGFARYSRRLIGRRFHALRVVEQSLPMPQANESLLIFANHPGWWDPLTAVVVNECLFAPRQFYAPIDGEALQKYAVLKRLGFFAVRKHADAAHEFQRTMLSILRPEATVFITPEGQFTDVRSDVPLRPGLAQLLAGLREGIPLAVIPMALEYVFWNESTPEILVEFGERVRPATSSDSPPVTVWDQQLRTALRDTQQSLSQRAIARSAEPFRTLVGGAAGERGIYDVARRLRSWLTGRRFVAEHEQTSSAAGAKS